MCALPKKTINYRKINPNNSLLCGSCSRVTHEHWEPREHSIYFKKETLITSETSLSVRPSVYHHAVLLSYRLEIFLLAKIKKYILDINNN